MSYSGGLGGGGGHHGGGGGGGGGGHHGGGGGGGGGHHGGGGGHHGGGGHGGTRFVGGGVGPGYYGPGYAYDVVDTGPYVVVEDAADWTVYTLQNGAWVAYPGGEHLGQDAARQMATNLTARGIQARVEGR